MFSGLVQIPGVSANISDVANKNDTVDQDRSLDKARSGILPGSTMLQQAINSDVINKVLLALREDKNGITVINSDSTQRKRSSSTQSAPEVMKAVANAKQPLHPNDSSKLHSVLSSRLSRKKRYEEVSSRIGVRVSGSLSVDGINGLSRSSQDSEHPDDKEVTKSKDTRVRILVSF